MIDKTSWWDVVKFILAKLGSRKFVVTLVAMAVAALVLYLPGMEDQLLLAGRRVAALLVLVGVAWQYVKTEGEIDKAREGG